MTATLRYSPAIRVMHALIAAAIAAQLTLTLVMDHPRAKGRAMTPDGAYWFSWHEWVGLFAFAVLGASWAYRTAVWKRQSQGRLFPWLTADGRAGLQSDLRAFARLRWSEMPADGALAGTVHGLGLLLATEFAATGTLLYVLLWPDNVVTPLASRLMYLHQLLGPLMWAYLVGHALMALWHQYAGHRSLQRMFRGE